MVVVQILSFVAGFALVLAIGVAARLLVGIRLNLYFLNREHIVALKEPGAPARETYEQSIIPITAEARKTDLLRTLKKKRWHEDVDITLMDDQGQSFTYRVGFHVWHRFYLVLKQGSGDGTALDGEKLTPQRRYFLRTGSDLKVGDRRFSVLVTPSRMGPDLHRELYDPVN